MQVILTAALLSVAVFASAASVIEVRESYADASPSYPIELSNPYHPIFTSDIGSPLITSENITIGSSLVNHTNETAYVRVIIQGIDLSHGDYTEIIGSADFALASNESYEDVLHWTPEAPGTYHFEAWVISVEGIKQVPLLLAREASNDFVIQ